ncbi:MAG: hypothetical protein MAG551_00244 [Candidatus Scalindua arabica]|uniref:DUF86 domain-containing protein n=1 Tax=Candidatus Scalindua arabica TaxID=1127984 RepID=A0A941VZX8_9BACT|nr:hypothetical protein [Candidatus Scalindua arabica]
MPKFNIDRIRQISGEINVALSKLRKISELKEDEFIKAQEKIDSAKYNLIVVIEGAIDICNHIVAKAGGRSPCDYADCFSILGELEIFSEEFVERFRKMAKFRNLLVHLYWKVDNRKVYKVIKEDIGDIEEYLEGIGIFVGKKYDQ